MPSPVLIRKTSTSSGASPASLRRVKLHVNGRSVCNCAPRSVGRDGGVPVPPVGRVRESVHVQADFTTALALGTGAMCSTDIVMYP